MYLAVASALLQKAEAILLLLFLPNSRPSVIASSINTMQLIRVAPFTGKHATCIISLKLQPNVKCAVQLYTCFRFIHPTMSASKSTTESQATDAVGSCNCSRYSSCDPLYATLAITSHGESATGLQSAKLPILRRQSTALGCVSDTATLLQLNMLKASWQ